MRIKVEKQRGTVVSQNEQRKETETQKLQNQLLKRALCQNEK